MVTESTTYQRISRRESHQMPRSLARRSSQLRTSWLIVIATCIVIAVLLLINESRPGRTVGISSANFSPVPQGTFKQNAPITNEPYKLIGWNDLGMHCMNENFANMAVLPPYNTMWAQVVQQGDPPRVVTTSVAVDYNIIDNTYSACGPKGCKSNFWDYAGKLFPGSAAANAPNVGLKGATLSGTMSAQPDHFLIEGIPLTPYLDSAPAFTSTHWYPYQRAHMVARDTTTGQVLAETIAVAPVSTEMRCDTCHADGKEPGGNTGNVEMNILAKHDEEEGTQFSTNASLRPVLCASCHSSNALGAPGQPGIPSLSLAMHNRHRLQGSGAGAEGTNNCYLCHPGQQTQCLRDTMYSQGLTCTNCHGNTANVADSQLAPTSRQPWKQEPSCAGSGCHSPQFAPNPNTLYRNSTGHGGMYCEACHGSPHAILPTIQPNDNLQNIALQGHAGVLNDCRVCHTQPPVGAGPHGFTYTSTVQGAITTTNGLPLLNVSLSAGGQVAVSGGLTGAYTLANLPPGTYTVTPQLAGYAFSPSYRVVNVPAGKLHQDFTAMSVANQVYLPLTLR